MADKYKHKRSNNNSFPDSFNSNCKEYEMEHFKNENLDTKTVKLEGSYHNGSGLIKKDDISKDNKPVIPNLRPDTDYNKYHDLNFSSNELILNTSGSFIIQPNIHVSSSEDCKTIDFERKFVQEAKYKNNEALNYKNFTENYNNSEDTFSHDYYYNKIFGPKDDSSSNKNYHGPTLIIKNEEVLRQKAKYNLKEILDNSSLFQQIFTKTTFHDFLFQLITKFHLLFIENRYDYLIGLENIIFNSIQIHLINDHIVIDPFLLNEKKMNSIHCFFSELNEKLQKLCHITDKFYPIDLFMINYYSKTSEFNKMKYYQIIETIDLEYNLKIYHKWNLKFLKNCSVIPDKIDIISPFNGKIKGIFYQIKTETIKDNLENFRKILQNGDFFIFMIDESLNIQIMLILIDLDSVFKNIHGSNKPNLILAIFGYAVKCIKFWYPFVVSEMLKYENYNYILSEHVIHNKNNKM